jgi:DNA (cytosine-5)-methyltransferase 1
MTHTGSTSGKAIRSIDLFCGAGGSSWGARNADVQIVAGFDMWPLAGEVFRENFPEAKFYPGKLENINPTKLAKELGEIDLILASPECTNHSVARGRRKRSEASRKTAFNVLRFARALKPRWIIIENVSSMRRWKRYGEFLDKLQGLGYQIREQILNSGEFGVPQSRKRLFILCDRQRKPAKVQLPLDAPRKTARDVIDLNGRYSVSPLKGPRRAKATLQRARRAVRAVGSNIPFLLVYYSSDKAGGWQRLNAPLRTITTIDRFALVKPGKKGPMMRMLQVPELKKAMGFPERFEISHGTRREKVRLLGNAVCPPVMKTIVRSLTRGGKSSSTST